MKIKLNDQVLVIAGKDKGKKGKVTKLLRKQNKIVVEKVNIRTKFRKKTTQQPGEMLKLEGPIDASNAMVICPSCKEHTRAGYKLLETGKKQRICKKCKESLDQNEVKSKK